MRLHKWKMKKLNPPKWICVDCGYSGKNDQNAINHSYDNSHRVYDRAEIMYRMGIPPDSENPIIKIKGIKTREIV